jgi:hypothetical protein
VSSWGPATYGDPCRGCGFRWSMTVDEALAVLVGAPQRYGELLRGREGSTRHPELSWTASAYVCHVGDNLRIWAERLAGVARGAERRVSPYDQDELATARVYAGIAAPAALWSLERAVRDWSDAFELASAAGVGLDHPERGPLTPADVALTNAHDAFHHEWDLRRTLGAG